MTRRQQICLLPKFNGDNEAMVLIHVSIADSQFTSSCICGRWPCHMHLISHRQGVGRGGMMPFIGFSFFLVDVL